ncbi:MAG: redoxin domain-containing protein [Catenulispora sp.]|nr:redoxin domain-containing protein [Catenulispora sp.]
MVIIQCPNCGQNNRVPADAAGVPHCGRCKTALPWLTSATDDDFDKIATHATLPVLVDLWAPWCGPCRIVEPGVTRAAEELAGRLKVVKVNVDTAPRTAERFAARSIPLLVMLRNGNVVSQQFGAIPPDQLLAFVNKALAVP